MTIIPDIITVEDVEYISTAEAMRRLKYKSHAPFIRLITAERITQYGQPRSRKKFYKAEDIKRLEKRRPEIIAIDLQPRRASAF
jgi:hypothetical protein